MAALDVYPVTVRGPIGPRDHHASFSRLFVYAGELYVARGRQRGAEVMGVTKYPLPDGEPLIRGRTGSWGEWAWSGCGCSSRWGQHTVAGIAQMV